MVALTPNKVECMLLFPSPAPTALDDATETVEFFRKSSRAFEASMVFCVGLELPLGLLVALLLLISVKCKFRELLMRKYAIDDVCCRYCEK